MNHIELQLNLCHFPSPTNAHTNTAMILAFLTTTVTLVDPTHH